MDHYSNAATPTLHLDTSTGDEQRLSQWSCEDVAALCEGLGLGDHREALHGPAVARVSLTATEHSIGGTTIAVADHEMLRDLGFSTVGQRLALLRAVYEIKCREGYDFDDERTAPIHGYSDDRDYDEPLTPLIKRHTAGLEHEVRLMREQLDSLQTYVDDLAHKMNATDAVVNEIKARPRSGHRPNLSVDTSRSARRSPRSARKRITRIGHLSPSMPSEGESVTPTRTGNSPNWTSSEQNSPLPPATTSPLSYDKPRSPHTPLSVRIRDGAMASPKAERRAGAMYESPRGLDRFAQTLSAIPPVTPVESFEGAVLTPSTGGGHWTPDTPESTRPLLSRQGSNTSTNSGSKRGLSDTCVQILPAAVKKYGLKSPWHEYVMLVSSPSLPTKRTLSYDERPRLIVNELKATGAVSVSCMIQHQSDLRSPLSLAQSRRQKAFRRMAEGQSHEGLPRQILPAPCGQARPGAATAKYGLCIYSYAAERSEELDVDYSDPVSIIARDGDWMTISRIDANGKQATKSGLVPACCVLETLIIPPVPSTSPASSRGRGNFLDPVNVLSPWSQAFALVDRTAHTSGELELHKFDRLRLYFRCSHWTWAISERTGLKGWAPAWLVSSDQSDIASIPRPSGSVSNSRLAPPSSPGR